MSIAALVAAIKSALDGVMGLFNLKERRHRQAVQEATLILQSRAMVMLTTTNLPSLPRWQWAALLPDPSLIDEALIAIGAEHEPGKDDRWIIRPGGGAAGKTIDRFRATRFGE